MKIYQLKNVNEKRNCAYLRKVDKESVCDLSRIQSKPTTTELCIFIVPLSFICSSFRLLYRTLYKLFFIHYFKI